MTRADNLSGARGHSVPPGFWPIDARYPHVTVAGCSLHCARCGEEGRAPLPRAAGYGAVVTAFLAEHKGCHRGAA
jgi:hypothetical protein